MTIKPCARKRASQFRLPNGILINVTHALYTLRGKKTLLSFKGIRVNEYDAEIHDQNEK